MILIGSQPLNLEELRSLYAEGSIQRTVLEKLQAADAQLKYDSLDQLKFELELRNAIVSAARQLHTSGMDFEVFRDTRANPDYWRRTGDGGFVLKDGVRASDAINDIFVNGRKYGTECATAMVIVYYKALLDVLPEELFNKLFSEIHLMNWHYLDRNLKEIGLMRKPQVYLPGDRRYFANPDVNPETPEWQGENVIDLGDGKFYGHGMGIYGPDTIIRALNLNRAEDADESAYLMDTAGRPNFKRLFDLYNDFISQSR